MLLLRGREGARVRRHLSLAATCRFSCARSQDSWGPVKEGGIGWARLIRWPSSTWTARSASASSCALRSDLPGGELLHPSEPLCCQPQDDQGCDPHALSALPQAPLACHRALFAGIAGVGQLLWVGTKLH